MNKNILKKAILIATSLWACQSIAVGFTVPNTFVSGTAASAAEVNANFEAIETGIDNNANNINTNITDINTNTANIAALSGGGTPALQLKDANGVVVGRVVGTLFYSGFHVLTGSGYRTILSSSEGDVQIFTNLYYVSSDCTGAGYALKGLLANNMDLAGVVFEVKSVTPTPPYYIPYDEPLAVITTGSFAYYDSGSAAMVCFARTTPDQAGYLVYPNDPVVTGISNIAYPARMIVE